MIVSVEMYFEYHVDNTAHMFRCFVPQSLDQLTTLSTASLTLALLNGNLNTVHRAILIVDLANKKVLKDRFGRYKMYVGEQCVDTPVTSGDVSVYRKQPVTSFEDMQNKVEALFTPRITEFWDDMRFLSNFYPAEFVWNHILWPNSEAAYQAAKTNDRSVWMEFAKQTNPAVSKREGKKVDMRKDWDAVKLQIMRDIVFEKFRQNPDLRRKLIATGSAVLEEGNTWQDTFWGICPPGSGIGKNHLGKILMDVRRELSILEF